MKIPKGFKGYAAARGGVGLGEEDRKLLVASEAAPASPAEPQEAPKEATLLLYEVIGFDPWTGGGVTAKKVIDDLKALEGAPQLDVRINSPGGDVFEGIAIYNALARFPGRVVVHVDALAASIATVVMMAGHEIRAAENSQVMVHFPWTWTAGDEDEFRSMADKLAKAWTAIASTYQRRTGTSAAALAREIRKDASRQWWMTAKEAKAAGFVDVVTAPDDVKALHDPRVALRARGAGDGGVELVAPRVERDPREPAAAVPAAPATPAAPVAPVAATLAPESGDTDRRRRVALVAELES